MRKIGRYQIIGAHLDGAGSSDRAARLILDTCVAIDMQNFYFGGSHVDRESLRLLLSEFPVDAPFPTDLNYGWALSESGWPRSGVFNFPGTRSLKYAVSEMVEWGSDRIEYEFSQTDPPASRDAKWPRHAAMPDPSEASNSFPLIAGTYAAMLYICHLERTRKKWKQRGTSWAIQNYYDWMKDTLGVLLHFEFALGVDMLAARNVRKQSAQQLLKYGGSETPDEVADKAWNAAWDIWFMRLPEGLTYGLLHGAETAPAALVTANKDPGYIRQVSELRTFIDTGEGVVPFALNTWDDTIQDAEFLKSLLRLDLMESLARSKRNPKEVVQRVIATVDSLEREIGVERRSVAAYFDSGVAESELLP